MIFDIYVRQRAKIVDLNFFMAFIDMVPKTLLIWADFVTFWTDESFRLHVLSLYMFHYVGFYTRIVITFIALPVFLWFIKFTVLSCLCLV